MTKTWENLQLKKIVYFLKEKKLQFTYPYASIKDGQATGEAFSPQKRTYSPSKHENSLLFSTCGSSLPSWIRQLKCMWIRIHNPVVKTKKFYLTVFLVLRT
jgi:hypothetical protein